MKVLYYEPKHILTIAGRCALDCPACLVKRTAVKNEMRQ